MMENILYSYSVNYAGVLLQIITLASIIFGIYTIISKNPIISVLFLIGLFASISLYLITTGLQFIGFSYLIVYIGAISILFIFILMLINIRVSELLTDTNNSMPLAVLVVLFFSLSFNNVIPLEYIKSLSVENLVMSITTTVWESTLTSISHINIIGNILYSQFFIIIIILAYVLLLAMVGSILMTVSSSSEDIINKD